MNPQILIDVFEAVLKNFPAAPVEEAKTLLRAEIAKRHYDLQDEAFVEKLIEDEENPLETDFMEAFQYYVGGLNLDGNALREFLKTDEGLRALTLTFLANVESSIDQIYNTMIARQFSES